MWDHKYKLVADRLHILSWDQARTQDLSRAAKFFTPELFCSKSQ